MHNYFEAVERVLFFGRVWNTAICLWNSTALLSRDFVKHFRAMSTRVRGEMPCKGTRNSHHHPGRNDKVSRKKNIFLSDPVGCRLSRCNRKCSSFFFARFYRHCQWWGIHCANTSWIPFQSFFSLSYAKWFPLTGTHSRALVKESPRRQISELKVIRDISLSMLFRLRLSTFFCCAALGCCSQDRADFPIESNKIQSGESDFFSPMQAHSIWIFITFFSWLQIASNSSWERSNFNAWKIFWISHGIEIERVQRCFGEGTLSLAIIYAKDS